MTEYDLELRREVERLLCSKQHCSGTLHAPGLLLVRRFEELSQALTALAPLLASIRFDGTEDMAEHAEAQEALERAREIVARALRGEA